MLGAGILYRVRVSGVDEGSRTLLGGNMEKSIENLREEVKAEMLLLAGRVEGFTDWFAYVETEDLQAMVNRLKESIVVMEKELTKRGDTNG